MTAKHKDSPSVSYADAGVSIDAGNKLVDGIKPLAKATARCGSMGGIGGFGALFDVKALSMRDPLLVSTTDGVGTKLKLAIDSDYHDTIGIDLVAMCVNDLIVQGAEPLFFLDYFACGALDVARAQRIIAGIAKGCELAGCALSGGETAEMPGMYSQEDYDLAGFSVGAVERDALLPRDVQAGDVLLGLASSGVHSNGYSLVRHILQRSQLRLDAPAPFATGKKTGEALLVPTRIYVKPVLAALRNGGIHALAHITGGGLTENLPRVLPQGIGAQIDLDAWALPPVFQWLREHGPVSDEEMLRTFNCGIGMVIVAAASEADQVSKRLEVEGETVFRIGTLGARGKEAVTYTGSL